ncbi:MAG TPA: hypothetical protein VJ898_12105 [Natrialbaceae archaeon]|nr:hypothetical protein [Natrialbaceae archaeon]
MITGPTDLSRANAENLSFVSSGVVVSCWWQSIRICGDRSEGSNGDASGTE